jgi:hypothetical protein
LSSRRRDRVCRCSRSHKDLVASLAR